MVTSDRSERSSYQQSYTPQRHSNNSETFKKKSEKIEIHFYEFMTILGLAESLKK